MNEDIEIDDEDRLLAAGKGRWLRHPRSEHKHTCVAPHTAGLRDLWECSCGAIYVWSADTAGCVGWRRVWFRARYFRSRYGG